jgi:hypothetical protein
MTRIIALALAVLGCTASARADGLSAFLATDQPITGRQHYLAGLRVPRRIAAVLGKVGLVARQMRARTVVQVTNQTLERFVESTERGYLEVVVPAGKGHVFFRHGRDVFDFYPGGFRVGGVRPIGSERYGMLIPLTADQERAVTRYLGRLKGSEGKELGEYDFSGEKGFHCVSWMCRAKIDPQRGNLVGLLGGKPRDAESMPRFARFLLKRARPLDAVVVYQDEARTAKQLDRMRFDIMSLRDLIREHASAR